MMITIILSILLVPSPHSAYYFTGENIVFEYPATSPNQDIFLTGNFKGWKKNLPEWKLKFSPESNKYILKKKISDVKSNDRNFYEFSFVLNDKILDAEKDHPDAIYCQGFGYRYVIRWK